MDRDALITARLVQMRENEREAQMMARRAQMEEDEREAQKAARMAQMREDPEGFDFDNNVIAMINDEMFHTHMGSTARTHPNPEWTRLRKDEDTGVHHSEEEGIVNHDYPAYNYFMSKMSRAMKYDNPHIRTHIYDNLSDMSVRSKSDASRALEEYIRTKRGRRPEFYDFSDLYTYMSRIRDREGLQRDILDMSSGKYKTFRRHEHEYRADIRPFVNARDMAGRIHRNAYNPSTGVFGR